MVCSACAKQVAPHAIDIRAATERTSCPDMVTPFQEREVDAPLTIKVSFCVQYDNSKKKASPRNEACKELHIDTNPCRSDNPTYFSSTVPPASSICFLSFSASVCGRSSLSRTPLKPRFEFSHTCKKYASIPMHGNHHILASQDARPFAEERF
jgi:hypothetical protein